MLLHDTDTIHKIADVCDTLETQTLPHEYCIPLLGESVYNGLT